MGSEVRTKETEVSRETGILHYKTTSLPPRKKNIQKPSGFIF